jgi:hypothetical protein
MAKLKEFITALAKKAGYDTESEGAKAFFEALPESDMPDDIHKGIDNALISLTEATNNHREIKNHYTKQALDGMDKEFLSLIEDFQLDEPTKAEVLAEKSTYKRGPLLTRKIVELERKKIATTGGKDKAAIQAEIDGLHSQLKTVKESWENDKKSFENQRLQDRINNKKNVFYSGMKTIHDELDPETKYTIIDSQVQKELQDRQAKFALDEHGNAVLMRNDGTNFFGENHQQVKPLQFIEQVLAKNKQLKVTDSSSTGPNGTKPQNGAQPTSTSSNGTKDSQSQSAVINRNNQALADYESAAKTGAFGV